MKHLFELGLYSTGCYLGAFLREPGIKNPLFLFWSTGVNRLVRDENPDLMGSISCSRLLESLSTYSGWLGVGIVGILMGVEGLVSRVNVHLGFSEGNMSLDYLETCVSDCYVFLVYLV